MDTSGKLWIREGNLVVEVGGGHNPFDRMGYDSNNGVGDYTVDAAAGAYQPAGFKSRPFGFGQNTPDGSKKYILHAVLPLSKSLNAGTVTVKLYMGQAGDKTDDVVYIVQESHHNNRPEFQVSMLVKLTPAEGDLFSLSFETDTDSMVIRTGDTAGQFGVVTVQLIEF